MHDPELWASGTPTLPTKRCLGPVVDADPLPYSLRPTATPIGVWETDTTTPTIEGYEILGELGRGGGGVVYRAWDQRLQRDVAIKMLHAHESDADTLRRFQAEAETVACLRHPNIVQIHEIGRIDRRPYLVLEFLAGGSLAGVLRGQPQAPEAAATILALLARIVQHAHDHAIIHRDLKPGNILITQAPKQHPPTLADVLANDRSDRVKVADFGIAKQMHLPESHTLAGTALGTPGYMAPEQGQETPVGPATDIYSLGAILYEFLTGRPPHQGVTPWDILMRSRTTEPLPPRRLQSHIPRDLETICLKCLAIQPERRYASASALADDLERYLRHEPIHARPVRRRERAWKWAKRHPSTAALLGVTSFALLTASVGGWLYSEQMRAERNRADALKLAAERSQAREHEARLETQHERDRVVQRYRSTRELVDRTVRRVAKLLQTNPALPQDAQRQALLEDALAFYRSYFADTHPDEREWCETTRAYLGLATCLEALGKHDEAAPNYQHALALLQDLSTTNNERAELRTEIAVAHLDFADYYQRTHQPDLARKHTDEGIVMLRELLAEKQASSHACGALAEALNQRAVQHQQAGRLPEAAADWKEVHTLRQEAFAACPSAATQFDLATSHFNLASIHKGQGDPKAAVKELQAALQCMGELFKKHAPQPEYWDLQARVQHNLGNIEGPVLNNWPIAQKAFSEAYRVRQKLVGTAYHGPESMLNMRHHFMGVLESAAQVFDHRQVAARASELPRLYPNDLPAQEVAFIAHVRACHLVTADATLDETERNRLAKTYADDAMKHLKKAVDMGYRKADFLKGNPNFAVLAERADYQELLKQMAK